MDRSIQQIYIITSVFERNTSWKKKSKLQVKYTWKTLSNPILHFYSLLQQYVQ